MIKAIQLGTKTKWVEPIYTGQVAICPVCKSEVKAAIYSHQANRFRHSFNTGCAYENKYINDWHIAWQSLFDITEFRYPDMGLRADVVFPKGTVLELQNSALKYSEMKIRENGYKKMAWLFNLTSEKYQKNITVNGNTLKWEYPNKHWLCYTKPSFFQVDEDVIIDLTKMNFIHSQNDGGYNKTILTSEFYSYTVDQFIDLMYKMDNSGYKEFPISLHRIL